MARRALRPVSEERDDDEAMRAVPAASHHALGAMPRPPPLPVRGLTDGSFTIGPLPSPGNHDASTIPRLTLPAVPDSPRGRSGRAGSVTTTPLRPKGLTPSLAVIVRLLELNLQGLEDSLASLGVTVVNGAFITAASVPLPEETGADDGSSAGGASPRDGPATFTRGWSLSMTSPLPGADTASMPAFPPFVRRGLPHTMGRGGGGGGGVGVEAGSVEVEVSHQHGGRGQTEHTWSSALADATPEPQAKRHRIARDDALWPTQATVEMPSTPPPPTVGPVMRTPSPPPRVDDTHPASHPLALLGAHAQSAHAHDAPAPPSPGRAGDAIRPLPATPPRPTQSTPPRPPAGAVGPSAVSALLRSASGGSAVSSSALSPVHTGSPMIHGTPQSALHGAGGGGGSAPGSAGRGTPQHASAFSAARSPARVTGIMSPAALSRAPSSSSASSTGTPLASASAVLAATADVGGEQPRMQSLLRLAGGGGGGGAASRRPASLPTSDASHADGEEDVAMTPLAEARSPMPSPAGLVRNVSAPGTAGSRGGAPLSTHPASTPMAAVLPRPSSAGIIRSTSALSTSSSSSSRRVKFATQVLHVEESRRRARLASMEELPYAADGTTTATTVEGEAMVNAVAAAHAEISLEVEAVTQVVAGGFASQPGWSSPRLGPGRAMTPTQGLHLTALSPLLSASMSSLNVSFTSDDGAAGGGGGFLRASQSPFTLPQSQASAASSSSSAAPGPAETGVRVAGSHVVMSLGGCPSPQPFRLSATPILPAGPLQSAHFPLAARLPGAWPHASPSARCLSGHPPSFSPVSAAYEFRMWHAARRRARAEAAGLDGVAAVCTGPQYGAAGEIDAFHSEDAKEAQIAALKKAYTAAVHELRLLESWFPDAIARLLPRATAACWLASAGQLRTPRDTPVFETSRAAWRLVLSPADAGHAGASDGSDDVPPSQDPRAAREFDEVDDDDNPVQVTAPPHHGPLPPTGSSVLAEGPGSEEEEDGGDALMMPSLEDATDGADNP